MFNLLPENLRKKIITEYKLRLVIVIILSVIIVQMSFLVFLFPSWLISYYKEKDSSIRNEEINQFLSTLDISSTTSYIRSLNTTLNIVNETLEYPKLVPVLDSILAKRTSNIRFKGINYSVNSSDSAVITLSGIGSTRESLVSFTKSLEQIESFKKVDLPISNLAKDKNIDFSISINIEK